jgi:hypothetical protein
VKVPCPRLRHRRRRPPRPAGARPAAGPAGDGSRSRPARRNSRRVRPGR